MDRLLKIGKKTEKVDLGQVLTTEVIVKFQSVK